MTQTSDGCNLTLSVAAAAAAVFRINTLNSEVQAAASAVWPAEVLLQVEAVLRHNGEAVAEACRAVARRFLAVPRHAAPTT